MAFDLTQSAPDIVVALLLLFLAGLLVARRKVERPNLLLATFLGLTALEFLANTVGGEGPMLAGYAMLAVDPLFLLLFTTAHPYLSRTRLHRAALAWLACAAVASIVLTFADPSGIYWRVAPHASPARLLLLLGIVCLGYTLSWQASVRALANAPTDGLAERARWTCLAVGVAIVPGLPVFVGDLHLITPGATLGSHLAYVAEALAIMAAAVLLPVAGLRSAPRRRSALRTVAAVAVAAPVLFVADDVLGVFGAPANTMYGLRWVAFFGIVLYAVIAHQAIQLPASARRALPFLGAVVAGVLVSAIAVAWAAPARLAPWVTPTVAGAAGLGVAMPGAWGARRLVTWAERSPGASHAERRLILYSAAVESALAGGTASRLGRVRGYLGVSREEARVVEELVQRNLETPRRGLRPGDEPLPGVVVRAPLAGGSQGRTFLARRMPGGGAVVVKLLTARPAAARRELWRELDALRRLDHPRLPRLVGFALDPLPCVAYEHIPGRTLAAALRDGPLGPPALEGMVRDLLDALAALHAAGIAHGDLKPANVILRPDGHAVLIDFGVAGPAAPRATLAGDAAAAPTGTLAYMAPEQARTGKATAAADLFALGLVVREALAGAPARHLDGLAVYQALERVAREPVPVEAAPEPWRPFLRACLDMDPQRRGSPAGLVRLLPTAAVGATAPGGGPVLAPAP